METLSLSNEHVEHPKTRYAFFICFVAAVGGFLFGYDLVIICGAQIFLRQQFHLTDAQFGFATASALLGCVAGPFLGAWMCDKMGRRKTMILSTLLFGVSAIGTALPRDILTFNIFRIIGGFGVGICSVASPMYIAEVAPARIRGGLGVMYQMAIAIGCMASSVVSWLLAKYLADTVSWRWMFGSEMVAIIAFVILLFFVPESPRWLSEKDRFGDALVVLTKIDGAESAEKEMKEIRGALAEEIGGFSEIFQRGMRWALLIGFFLAIFNNWSGWSAMGFYAPTIFQKSGFPHAADAIFQSLIINTFMVFITLLAVWIVDRFGRKPLWIFGSAMMVVSLLLTGIAFQFNVTGLPILFLVFLCAIPHAIALGPLPWLMMSELFPTRIRAKAVAATTTVCWIAGFSAPMMFPILAGYSERMIGSIGGVFWLLAIVAFLSLLFGFKMLPETKGKTLEEIGRSWMKK